MKSISQLHTLPQLQERWEALSNRDRNAVRTLLLVLLLVLVWTLAVAPAWHTLRTAPAQRQVLVQQHELLLQLQSQARRLQAQPSVKSDQVLSDLRASLQLLGSNAQLLVNGEQATVTLKQVSAAGLSSWLIALRREVRLQPVKAQITRVPQTSNWDGSLVFVLPPR